MKTDEYRKMMEEKTKAKMLKSLEPKESEKKMKNMMGKLQNLVDVSLKLFDE